MFDSTMGMYLYLYKIRAEEQRIMETRTIELPQNLIHRLSSLAQLAGLTVEAFVVQELERVAKSPQECEKILKVGNIVLDTTKLTVMCLGRKLSLPNAQRKLLTLLMTSVGSLVTREQIEANLWPPSINVNTKGLVCQYIYQIRKTLGDDAGVTLETVARVGYYLKVKPTH